MTLLTRRLGASWSHDAHGPLFAIIALVDLERDRLADAWMDSIMWERGDMHENFCAAACPFNEAETALFIPLG